MRGDTSDAGRRMDRMYRLQRHIYDATRRYYLLGRTTLIDGLAPPDGGTVLEIGCGTGWNLIETARKYPDARLYGLDVSAAMLETARRKIAKAGLQDRIALAVGDATTFSGRDLFGVAAFDRIAASYVLSMIPAWPLAIRQAAGQLAPAGALHIVDFGSAAGLPAPFRVALHAWLRKFDVTPRLTLEAEVGRAADYKTSTPHFTELHRGYAQYAVLRRG
jgi:S-adenosylmethionine-diacylgycerolhomoserine-N-methlytransferase